MKRFYASPDIRLLLLAGFFCTTHHQVKAQPPGPNPTDIASKSWVETKKKGEQLKTDSPTEAVALYQKFLQEFPQRGAEVTANVYERISAIQRNDLKNPEAGAKTLEEALEKVAGSKSAEELRVSLAQCYLDLGKNAQAEETLLKAWPKLMRQGPIGRTSLMWRRLFVAMKGQGKEDEANKLLEVAFRANPILMDDHGPNAGNKDWMFSALINSALERGDSKKALSWAKLRFVTCDYSENAMAQAGRLLGNVWSVSEPKSSAAFIESMTDPNKPNPLRAVPMPPLEVTQKTPFDVPDLADLWEHVLPHEKISLLLWRGSPSDYSRAMTEAVSLSTNKERAAEGIQEVCRVFKAADLNTVRVSEYLNFVKTGQGESPIPKFMMEQSKARAAD